MKTITVQLIKKTAITTDPFGAPVEAEELISVGGCLVGQPSSEQATDTMSMYGKRIAYVIGVPKEDKNDWVDTDVIIFGERFHTIGYPETGIQGNIPLHWGKNVKVERYGETYSI